MGRGSVSGDALEIRKQALDLLEFPSEFVGFDLERTAVGANECGIHLAQPCDCLLEHLLALRAENRYFHIAIQGVHIAHVITHCK